MSVESSSSRLKTEYVKRNCWGMLASLDLHQCDPGAIRSPKIIGRFIVKLCDHIGMKRYGKPMIKRFGEGELEGYSALQFIHTSSVTMHFDEIKNRAFIEIFSCKFFDPEKAEAFCKKFLKAEKSRMRYFLRH